MSTMISKDKHSDNGPPAMRRTLHELQLHQIELEMQNEELRRTQMELAASHARYFKLYDLAPVGYCTVGETGLILQANLSAANMLGAAPGALVKQPISRFIFKEDQDIYYLLRKQLLTTGEHQQRELRMVKRNGTPFWAHLMATATQETTGGPEIRIVLSDAGERRQAQEALRIAAIAFECQEGIAVLDVDMKILRVNRAFTRITGYSQQEVQGKQPPILGSARQPSSFYNEFKCELELNGVSQRETWNRRKSGDEYPSRITCTAVMDGRNQVTHYVANLVDATDSTLREHQRLLHEAALRKVLVREVHHRIKNNLQGIMGLLSQSALEHPDIAEPLNQAIGQVQSISVIHGLQGRSVPGDPSGSLVRLCELTATIALEIQNLWQTPVHLDIPTDWMPCVIAENEAVPIALVLNELIVNAVKHGGKTHENVRISLQKGTRSDFVKVTISNVGQLTPGDLNAGLPHSGLRMIAALMPPKGAGIVREQQGRLVMTSLELEPPVISLELNDPT